MQNENFLEDFMTGCHVSSQSIEKVESQLFAVDKLPLYGPTGERTPIFANFKQGEDPLFLGQNRGESFGLVQPTTFHESFLDCLRDINGLDLSTYEMKVIRGGQKIIFSCKARSLDFNNSAGRRDNNNLCINLVTGYDGLTKSKLYVSMWSQICTNGMMGFKQVYDVNWRNSKNNTGKIGIACSSLVKVLNDADDYADSILKLDNSKVTTQEIEKFTLDFLNLSSKPINELSTRESNTLAKLRESIDLELGRRGKTKWGLLNGATHFTNHQQNPRNGKLEHLTFGTGAKKNHFANELILSI